MIRFVIFTRLGEVSVSGFANKGLEWIAMFLHREPGACCYHAQGIKATKLSIYHLQLHFLSKDHVTCSLPDRFVIQQWVWGGNEEGGRARKD